MEFKFSTFCPEDFQEQGEKVSVGEDSGGDSGSDSEGEDSFDSFVVV